MAVVSDIEAVLEFLKVNGLSESESALMMDLLEKTETTSSDFDNFLFPMVPPLRPLRISENRRLPEAEIETSGVGGGVDSSGDSSEEFVSLGSSTDDVCSSEFTNPYGIRNTTKLSSQASSDRLSQFGTARDYHDFDMQNDLHWYNGVDDDYIVPPCFGRSDSLICPSEDKFVTTLETYKQIDSQLDLENVPEGFQTVEKSKYSEKHWPSSHFHSMDDVNGADGGVVDNEKKWSTVCSCSAPDCVGCADKEGFLSGDTLDPTVMYLKVAEVNNLTCEKTPTYDWDEEFKGAADFQIAVAKKDHNGDYKGASDGEKPGDPHVLDCTADEDEDRADQLLMYDSTEDEYETFNLRIIHRKNRTGFEENKDLPIVLSSVVAGRYYVTEYLGSAAFSKVVQAHDMHTGMDVCLKIIINNKDFFDQSLDEVKLLKFVNKHDPRDERHILRLYDYFYYQEHLFIVSELLRANLYEFHKYNQESGGEPYFTLSRLQLITQQCLEALEYLHHLGVIHCDLKPENILVKSYQRCEIKVIDLGSSCFSTDNLCLYVQSRSYRAPEVILGLPYDQKIDLWSLGCILAELCSGEVLFPNDAVVMLLSRMIGMLGPIDVEMLAKGHEIHKYFTKDFDLYHISEETNQLEYIIPEESSLEHHLQVSDTGFIDFVRSLLEINPQRRPTASIALQHPWLSYQYELNSH